MSYDYYELSLKNPCDLTTEETIFLEYMEENFKKEEEATKKAIEEDDRRRGIIDFDLN